jgi:hypothetical protein
VTLQITSTTMRFQAATPVQSVLFDMGDELQSLINDKKFVNDVDSTGTFVAKAAELLLQAEFAQLIVGVDALDYGRKLVQYAFLPRAVVEYDKGMNGAQDYGRRTRGSDSGASRWNTCNCRG